MTAQGPTWQLLVTVNSMHGQIGVASSAAPGSTNFPGDTDDEQSPLTLDNSSLPAAVAGCTVLRADEAHEQGEAVDLHPDVSASRTYSPCSTSSHHSLRIGASSTSEPGTLLRQVEKAVSMRLLPPLLMLVIVSYLDRTALSFASIQMSHDLNLSSSMYGLGSGAAPNPYHGADLECRRMCRRSAPCQLLPCEL